MQTKKVLNWLDQNILLLLASFLLAFIPLYPKLPLFDIIPGYIVRVRMEDFFVLITLIVWGVQVLRKKIEWKTPLTFAVLSYAVVGLLSTISGVLITHTIPAEFLHIGKSMLHYFRYMEYFSLFFIVYAAIKSQKDLKTVFWVIIITVFAISIYAIGQRFLYWPVYSTMNREFSKGVRLYLTEHARVQSTFGGHYDLAAYLVVITPILLAALYLIKNYWLKLCIGITLLLAQWTLVATVSRSSYAAFLGAMGVVVLLISLIKKEKWSQRILWTIKHGVILSAISLFILFKFGDDMYERLMQTLAAYPEAHNFYHENNRKRKEFTEEKLEQLSSTDFGQAFQNTFSFIQFSKVEPPEDGMSLADAEVLVSSDTQPTPGKPSDVYVDVPVLEPVATTAADGTETTILVEKERTYSDAAQTHGLSFAIRLDTLWPRALEGFYANPLLGTGYATLTKEAVGQFTEAESTDNNFLRTLGETGLLGFISFYGTVALSMFLAFKIYMRKDKDTFEAIFSSGFLAASFGLLVNAIAIDVFAASKVAFTYWGLAGLVVAMYSLRSEKRFNFDFMQRFQAPSSKIKKKTRKVS